jgi:hypothetical protein
MSEAPTCCDRPMWMIEVLGVYDGGLFFECRVCGARQHRWPEGHPLRATAEEYVVRAISTGPDDTERAKP